MIPTAFVVVSFSKPAMDKLFSTGATFKDLLKEAKENDEVFLFNNQGNANFIKLEHSYGKQNTLKLELIDPQQEFEQRIITNSLVDLAGAYLNPDQRVDDPAFDFGDQIEYKKQIEESREFFKDYTDKLRGKFGRFQLLVAYGVGENLASWSGPHITEIVNVDISIKGSRKFALTLQPLGSNLNSNERRLTGRDTIDLNLEGLRSVVKGNSSPLNFYDYFMYLEKGKERSGRIYSPWLGDPDLSNYPSKIKALQEDGATELLKEIDIHLLITECMRRFIRKATGVTNVIVLFPDLNKLLIDYIKEASNDVSEDTTLVSPSVSYASYNAAAYINAKSGPLLDIYSQTMSIIEGLGLDFSCKFKDGRVSINPNIETERERNYTDIKQRAEAFFFKRDFYAGINRTGKRSSVAGTQDKLDAIVNNILAASKSQPYSNFTKVTYFESDSKLLSLWALNSNNPVFNTEKYKFDETQPAIIYGDAELIHQYLYAEGGDNPEYKAPIHPVDQVGLDKYYRREVSKRLNKRLDASISGPFGETTFVPDEFMYIDEEQAAAEVIKKLVEEKRLTVFRYNVQNPNVIDLNFDFSPIYFAALKGAFEKEVSKRATATVEGVLDSKYSLFDLPTQEATIAYIRSRHQALGDNQEARDKIIKELGAKNLGSAFDGATEDENAKLAYALYDELLSRPDQPLIKVDQQLPGNPVLAVADFSERLYRQTLRLKLTSLPNFQESSFRIMRKPVLLLASDRPIKQSSPPDQSLLDTFFTGLYLITGYKHTISSGKAISEFNLQRMTTQLTERSKKTEDFELQKEEE